MARRVRVSRPTAAPAAADSVKVFFATNRDTIDGGFDKDSARDPSAVRQLWLGHALVEAVGDPEATTETARELLDLPTIEGADDPTTPGADAASRVLDAWLATAAATGSLPLLFIHGFANTFTDAMTRAAQITEFYGAAGVAITPLAFAWPSDGKVVDVEALFVHGAFDAYRSDQRDALAAGPALARLLAAIERACRRSPPARLALLAHSMGNLALSAGLAVMANGLLTQKSVGLFDHAVLAAADVPDTALAPAQPLRLVTTLAKQVTVAINYDPVLRVASETANGGRRLGHSGPADLATLSANVLVLDCYKGLSTANAERLKEAGGTEYDAIGHQYYRNDPGIRPYVAAALAGTPLPPVLTLAVADRASSGRRRLADLPLSA